MWPEPIIMIRSKISFDKRSIRSIENATLSRQTLPYSSSPNSRRWLGRKKGVTKNRGISWKKLVLLTCYYYLLVLIV